MEQRDKILEEYYAQMGIAKPVYDFCMKVEEELKDRFLSIDKTAECNQMKVLRAMQKNHLSEACFAPTTGYGYNDIGSFGATTDYLWNTCSCPCAHEPASSGR